MQEFLQKRKKSLSVSVRFFKRDYFANTGLVEPSDKIAVEFKKGFLTGMISNDIQKAFDTIDYQFLSIKKKYLGFSRDS